MPYSSLPCQKLYTLPSAVYLSKSKLYIGSQRMTDNSQCCQLGIREMSRVQQTINNDKQTFRCDGYHHPSSPMSHLAVSTFQSIVLNPVQLFAIPWAVAHQVPSVHGIFQASLPEWVASSSSRRSSWPRDWIHISWVSSTGIWIPLPLHHLGRSK